jgi:protocatechuate 3,4-dioxygenase beta subunit
MRYTYRSGKKELTPTGMVFTNDLGEYRIFGLSPGRYFSPSPKKTTRKRTKWIVR